MSVDPFDYHPCWGKDDSNIGMPPLKRGLGRLRVAVGICLIPLYDALLDLRTLAHL